MVARVKCPTAHELEMYLLGLTPDPDAVELDEHLSRCAHCLRSAGEHPGWDSLTDAARRAPEVLAAAPRDGVVNDLIQRLKRLRTVAATIAVTPPADASSAAPDPARALEEVLSILAPPQGPDELGRLGPYRIRKLIGTGGMGVVLLAEDPHLKRAVALKVMHPALAPSRGARDRFLREARAVAPLEHDHVVTVLQAGEDGGVLYLAMPVLKGETLDARLRREGRLPTSEALRITREVALGLAGAHAQGIVHRDIKPANVWLETGHGRVKILDFGLARILDGEAGESQSGTVIGTPQYMSPEQADGKPVTPHADLFSLGALLYHMTTGRPPFDGGSRVSVLLAVARGAVTPPEALDPAFPADVSSLLKQLLAPTPEARPASAQDVVVMIEAIERGTAPRASLPVRGKATGRAVAGVGGLLLVVVLGAGIAFGPQIYRLATDKGQLVIETIDPAVQVIIKQQGRLVTIVDAQSGYTVDLHSGSYTVALAAEKDGLRLTADRFTLRRGGREIVRVSLESKPPAQAPAAESSLRSPRNDRPERLIANYSKRLTANPRDVEALQERGAAYGRINEFDRAIDDLTQAIGIEPTAIRHEFRGWNYHRKGDFARAEADFQTAMQLDPKAAGPRLGLGCLARERKELDRARGYYDDAIRVAPTSAGIFHARAEFRLTWLGDLQGALADCHEALRLDALAPEVGLQARILAVRGEVYRRKGELDKALADLDEAVRLEPNSSDPYDVRAGIHADRKEYLAQRADLDSALKLQPQNGYALAHRGMANFYLGDYDRALADTDASIRLLPDFPWSYQFRAEAHEARGEIDLALVDYSKAIALDPRMMHSLRARARLYERKGETAKAKADREAAAQLERAGVK